jgi:glycopeptide antibiotics resistance protein
MRLLSKTILVLYLLFLLWLILFKLSLEMPVANYQMQTINFLPFINIQENPREVIDNLIIFIPFGLLLGVNFKQMTLWRRLVYIFAFSISVELLQYAFAIGIADITDIITNTAGGLIGLLLYDISRRYIHDEKKDRFIVIVVAILLIIFIILRSFVFKVNYFSSPALEQQMSPSRSTRP